MQVVYFEQLLQHDLILMEVLSFRSKYDLIGYIQLINQMIFFIIVSCVGTCFGLIATCFDAEEGATIAGGIAR